MKKRAKILLAAALAVCIILSVCVCLVVTSAANYSGSCGNNVTYSFTSGTLTVSGSGDMNSYSAATVPWADYRSQIKKVVVSDGITSVGYYAFSNCSELDGSRSCFNRDFDRQIRVRKRRKTCVRNASEQP